MGYIIKNGVEYGGSNIVSASTTTYNNSSSSLSADNVQSAVDEIKNSLDGIILNKLYPVGSIYLTTTNTNPGTKLGGTWEAYGTSDSYLRLGGNGNGGSNSVKLAANQIPSLTTGNNSVTPSVSSSGSCTISSSGAHGHTFWNGYTGQTQAAGAYGVAPRSGGSVAFATGDTDANMYLNGGEHTHTVPNHTHTLANTTHTHTYTNSNQQNVSITPKYVQVYAWKRIA